MNDIKRQNVGFQLLICMPHICFSHLQNTDFHSFYATHANIMKDKRNAKTKKHCLSVFGFAEANSVLCKYRKNSFSRQSVIAFLA